MDLQLSASLAVRVADRIRNGIIDGKFASGERLTEGGVARWLQVSNNPVREAFQLLEKEGLIVKEPRRGTYVRDFGEADVRYLYLVRSALDGVAYRLLLENGPLSDGVADQLQKCIQQQREASEARDYYRAVELDLYFHDIIYQSTEAEVLLNLWFVLRAQFRVLLHWRLQVHKQRGEPVGFSMLHEVIIDKLLSGDLSSLVRDNEKRHLQNSEDLVQALHDRELG